MTGNYGGEVLRRVRAFKPQMPTPELFRPEFLPHVRLAAETYTNALEGHPLSFAVFRQAPWHHYGLLALEQTQLSLRSPYLDNDFVRLVYRAPQMSYANNDVCLRLIADGNESLRRIRTDRGLAGGGQFSAAVLREVLDFTFKAEYAYDYGMPQSVARIDSMLSSLHLERIFLGRHKMCHFRVWYRDSLSKYVREMLLDPIALSRPYINRTELEGIVRHHIKGDRNYTTEIHKLLTLELVHRLFFDSGAQHSAPGSLLPGVR
jgi:asparagine synthase (glutamine-hydrolysing)